VFGQTQPLALAKVTAMLLEEISHAGIDPRVAAEIRTAILKTIIERVDQMDEHITRVSKRVDLLYEFFDRTAGIQK